eukprot:gene3073-3537_t
MASSCEYSLASNFIFVLISCLLFASNMVVAENNPGDKAPAFTLPAIDGPIVYKSLNNTNIKPPIIFHEYSSHSGFLDALWHSDASIVQLLRFSPSNTQYVFFSSTTDALEVAEWMKGRFREVLEKQPVEDDIGQKRFLKHCRCFYRKDQSFPKPFRGIYKEAFISEDSQEGQEHKLSGDEVNSAKIRVARSDVVIFMRKKVTADKVYPMDSEFRSSDSQGESSDDTESEKEKFIDSWMKRLHFVTIPIFQFGNWIPLVTSRWFCSGHGCGFDQIAFESDQTGDIKFISKRLDARYDWLPSPYTLKARHPKTRVVNYGDGCKLKSDVEGRSRILLVSREGSCSFFEKIQIGMKAHALAVIVYCKENEALTDMTCSGEECATESTIPGTMITYEAGQKLLKLLKENDVYARFQHTPTRNFFLALDEQGKLQEVGWLLFPSMRFLTYQAEWLNYKTSLLDKIDGMKETINIFNSSIMHGKTGVVKTVTIPTLEELQKYENVYLDMSLGCPGDTDYACPHWDHTVQLFLDCGSSEFAGEELGRWITPFRRRIGRWLTAVKPLIPLFTSTSCTFTMKTVPWAMAWKPSLRIQLSGRVSQVEFENTLNPYKIKRLFRGGTFDKDYNSRYSPKAFTVPSNAKKVKFYAVITGHGSDDNNCAEFCVTSHDFVVNKKFKNTRVFSNAGTPTGCADRVKTGVIPNEHGTWLYGRNGWCDGQEVDPWLEDITDQVDMSGGKVNTISYHGYFNGKDPAPKKEPGYIIMHSFLIFYK